MISLRYRKHDDWNYLFLSGDEEEDLCSFLGGKLLLLDGIVERKEGEEWIDLEEWEA